MALRIEKMLKAAAKPILGFAFLVGLASGLIQIAEWQETKTLLSWISSQSFAWAGAILAYSLLLLFGAIFGIAWYIFLNRRYRPFAATNNLSIDINKLSEYRLEIAIIGFHSAPIDLSVGSLSGNLIYQSNNGSELKLPTPSQRQTGVDLIYSPGREFMIVLTQTLDSESFKRINIDLGENGFCIRFEELNIVLRSRFGIFKIPLRVWRSPNLRRSNGGEIMRNYTIHMSVNTAASVSSIP